MSSKAVGWALEQQVKPATLKLLLIVMADCANPETRLCFPSTAALEKGTGLNRKTIPGAIDKLCEMGMLAELEERRGRTGQIKVYRFTFGERETAPDQTGPKSDRSKSTPKSAERGPESAGEGARNRATEPSSRNLEKEQTPPLPSEEPPLEGGDLFGGLPADLPEPIEDYVLRGWSKLHEQFPRVQDVRVLNDSRRRKIGARAAEIVRGTGGSLTPYQVWDQIFDAVRNSVFLRGEAAPSAKYPTPFSLSIDYILRPAVFLQTLERAVNDEHDNRITSDPGTGRRYGPAEQALRDALRGGLPAGKRRRRGGGSGRD
jgi:hypothetical protein